MIGHQLQTGEEETWRQAVTHLAGMLVVVGAIQCSPGSQTPLTVWIEAGKMLKCRVIVEAQVARACRRHPEAAGWWRRRWFTWRRRIVGGGGGGSRGGGGGGRGGAEVAVAAGDNL